MRHTGIRKILGVCVAFGAMILLGMMSSWNRVGARAAEEGNDSEEAQIKIGFEVAPVPLNLEGKNRALVGLGSYLVNIGDCNGCHSAGPQTEFAGPSGNPYFRIPPFSGKKKINPSTYLAGGRDFGPVGSVVHLYSRNLTPDITGRPIGGHTYQEFVEIIRHGTDFDHVHPNCTAPGSPANCFMPPFNGDLLQVMPWPMFQDRTDHELRAIYEYLSAIPCNPGQIIAGAPYLQNTCPH